MGRNKGLILLLFLVLFLTLSCNKSPQKGIVLTLYPEYLIVKELLPNDIPVKYIIKPSMNPHHFNLTMSMAQALENAQLIILNGFGMDNFIAKKYPHKNILLLSKSIKPLYDDFIAGNNPHFWLSPKEILRILPILKEYLCKLYPRRTEEIQKNYEHLFEQLNKLDKNIQKQFAPYKDFPILSYHPSFGYFFHDYGFTKTFSIKKVPQQELSAKELLQLFNQIKKQHIKILLVEVNIFDQLIDNIKEQFPNIVVVKVDPLGFTFGVHNYIELMEKNTNNILKGYEKAYNKH